MKLVTIIIPAMNECEVIEHVVKTINDVMQTQPYASEIIVVDDGSMIGQVQGFAGWGQGHSPSLQFGEWSCN